MMSSADHQLAFAFPHRPALGRDDFLIAPSNQQAMDLIERWPNWPGPIAVVVGPPGSGKSHLGEVWRLSANAKRIEGCAFGPEAVPQLLETGALLLEDLPGETLNEQALFHLINMARNEGGHILATSRTYPAKWPVRLPDLATRLSAAVVATLGAPDDSLLRAIMVKLFADRQLDVDDRVLNYLLMRMERSLAAANLLVETIDRMALAQKTTVNLKIGAAALAALNDNAAQE